MQSCRTVELSYLTTGPLSHVNDMLCKSYCTGSLSRLGNLIAHLVYGSLHIGGHNKKRQLLGTEKNENGNILSTYIQNLYSTTTLVN